MKDSVKLSLSPSKKKDKIDEKHTSSGKKLSSKDQIDIYISSKKGVDVWN